MPGRTKEIRVRAGKQAARTNKERFGENCQQIWGKMGGSPMLLETYDQVEDGCPLVVAAMLRQLDETQPDLKEFGFYKKNSKGKWVLDKELQKQMIKEDAVEKAKSK